MPLAASVTSILTASGDAPGHWVIVEDACRYWSALTTHTGVKSTSNIRDSFFIIVRSCRMSRACLAPGHGPLSTATPSFLADHAAGLDVPSTPPPIPRMTNVPDQMSA